MQGGAAAGGGQDYLYQQKTQAEAGVRRNSDATYIRCRYTEK